ncbi:uncharacterized protein BHQ10_002376 [Talaromyces amestolkiae]|uniref:Uncharacterized protein n=1 Tax=Talaromyces amestolkiae TaxID=1196081 RepID=A0A364KS39_TALAM|nr:uncharacterized protein BHQ10_002376 [Talaromyces amestolkiae]RAO66364.1 hypothetical protein BHQ10_002376 [Talaromyces amestolkiae]
MFVDSEAMRVGNREGLGLMEQMAKISSDLRAQKKINKEQKLTNERLDMVNGQQKLTNEEQKLVNEQQKLTNEEQKLRWCMVVYTEIEQKAHPQTEEAILARRERNQIIHGGNIIDHLEYIGFGKNKIPPGRHDSVRKAFEIWYEVPFRYKERIDHAPELVVRTFNRLADTKSLRVWSNAPTVHEVQKICRGIISRWLEWVDAGEGEYPDAYIRREFEKLESLKSG